MSGNHRSDPVAELPDTPCKGLRVLDCGWGMASNLASMVLADYGAEVIKVEAPAGDPWQRYPAWRFWNRGKRIVRLDLSSQSDRRVMLGLARDADVLLESFRPGVAERLGIGYSDIGGDNSNVIYCSITGFGRRGPYAQYKGYEGVVDAKTGRMLEFRGLTEDEAPGFVALPSASFGAAMGALQGILMALRLRHSTGRGCRVDTSLLQGNTAYDMIRWIAQQRAPSDPLAADRAQSWGALTRNVPPPSYLTAVTKDGVWLQFSNFMPHLYLAQMVALGLAGLYSDPRLQDLPMVDDPQASEEVWEAVLSRVREKTWAEWQVIFAKETDISVEQLRSTQESFDHPQVRASGGVIALEDTEQPAPLLIMGSSPGRFEVGPNPSDGDRLAWHSERVQRGSHSTSVPDSPLSGVTLVDFSTFYAAPFAAAILADYGARVIKVEPPKGDPARAAGGRLIGYKTTGGKQSLAVNLKMKAGKEIIARLLPQADILLHNFRPGVAERLGIGYEEVRAMNPRIVYHYSSSYGIAGPEINKPAFHPTIGAIAGGALRQVPAAALNVNAAALHMEDLKSLAWRVQLANESNPDVNSSLATASALLLGLLVRDQNGHGHWQATSMVISNLYANGDQAIRYQGMPADLEPDVRLYGTSPLYRLYKAKHGWVFLACTSQREWQTFCAAIGCDVWISDEDFATSEARALNASVLTSRLEALFKERDAAEWETLLSGQDVACVRADAQNVAEFILTDECNLNEGFTVAVEHPTRGRYLRHGPIATLDIAPSRIGPMCEVGEQTHPILSELGYSDAEIAELARQHVISLPTA